MSLFEEQHYSPQELAAQWGFSAEFVRRLFADEAGVLRVESLSRRVGRKLVRRYTTIRIPASTATRVYAKLSARRKN